MEKIAKIGDIITLKERYGGPKNVGIVVDIKQSTYMGKGGWISYVYEVMVENGEILNLSDACIKSVYSLKEL